MTCQTEDKDAEKAYLDFVEKIEPEEKKCNFLGKIGGFSFFKITGWENENGRRDFPNFLKKKFCIKIIYLKFVECKKIN